MSDENYEIDDVRVSESGAITSHQKLTSWDMMERLSDAPEIARTVAIGDLGDVQIADIGVRHICLLMMNDRGYILPINQIPDLIASFTELLERTDDDG